MKNKSRELKVFTPSFNVALLLSLVVGVGTYLEIPPMSTVINFSESIKDNASKKYGEPPYAHAELSSLKLFTRKQNLDLEKSIELLNNSNIQVSDASVTLAVIAAEKGLSPQEIFEIIKPASILTKDDGNISFPDTPMSGVGKMTLGALCSQYKMQELLSLVYRIADTEWSVLIRGETGTEKELIARLIHMMGPRKNRPFIEVNCAAIPENLFESELFGHEKGAFTGASSKRRGRFELAKGGALFLDEVGELPLHLQAKLLRTLQEKRSVVLAAR